MHSYHLYTTLHVSHTNAYPHTAKICDRRVNIHITHIMYTSHVHICHTCLMPFNHSHRYTIHENTYQYHTMQNKRLVLLQVWNLCLQPDEDVSSQLLPLPRLCSAITDFSPLQPYVQLHDSFDKLLRSWRFIVAIKTLID